jgi:hypothetical protein
MMRDDPSLGMLVRQILRRAVVRRITGVILRLAQSLSCPRRRIRRLVITYARLVC